MKLIVGLGNPGKEYDNTRHNIGKNVVIGFVKQYLKGTFKNHHYLKADVYKSGLWLFATPTTFMNLSGESVQKLAMYYKIEPEDIYIIHDDLDIPVGEYKIQVNRGAAGHHGVESIISHLKTNIFHRLRIGIGKPTDSTPIEEYVLKPLIVDRRFHLENAIDKVTFEEITGKIYIEIQRIITGH
jgi:PTH1 family peptidyl-tRNA hydrolase